MKKSSSKYSNIIISLGFVFFVCAKISFAQFTPGNIVVLQTVYTISKAPSQAILKEFTTSGASGLTVALDSTSGAITPFMTDGRYGGSEGFLTTSTDGKFLVLGGYNYSSAVDITATTASSVNRVVGKVDRCGQYTQMYSSSSFYNANDMRGAVSDGTNFWAAGASTPSVDGIDYFGPGAPTGLATAATPPSAYGMRIFNSQIYYSTQKKGPNNLATQLGIFSLSGGEPTSGPVTVSLPIINVVSVAATAIPEDFSFSNDGKTCYIAINVNTAVGGIQKWTNTIPWATSGWTYQYTLGTGVANVGAYGLVADYSGANPIIYATTFEYRCRFNCYHTRCVNCKCYL